MVRAVRVVHAVQAGHCHVGRLSLSHFGRLLMDRPALDARGGNEGGAEGGAERGLGRDVRCLLQSSGDETLMAASLWAGPRGHARRVGSANRTAHGRRTGRSDIIHAQAKREAQAARRTQGHATPRPARELQCMPKGRTKCQPPNVVSVLGRCARARSSRESALSLCVPRDGPAADMADDVFGGLPRVTKCSSVRAPPRPRRCAGVAPQRSMPEGQSLQPCRGRWTWSRSRATPRCLRQPRPWESFPESFRETLWKTPSGSRWRSPRKALWQRQWADS